MPSHETPEPRLDPPEYPGLGLRCSLCLHSVSEALEFAGGRTICRHCLEHLVTSNQTTIDDLAAILCAAVVE